MHRTAIYNSRHASNERLRVMNEHMPKKLMKSKQAAEYLCISERKLWDLQKSQRIPVVRIDRSVRFDHDDLDAFIANAKKR